MFIKMNRLIGIYNVEGESDVHLLEFEIESEQIDVGKFTQKEDRIDKMNWQVPWDEKFIDVEGSIKLVFFFHFLDLSKPLITPFGVIELMKTEQMPSRLSRIMVYEKPN